MVFCVFTLTDIVWGNIYWSIYVDWTAFLRWSDMEEIFSKSELLDVSATKILSNKNVLAYWHANLCGKILHQYNANQLYSVSSTAKTLYLRVCCSGLVWKRLSSQFCNRTSVHHLTKLTSLLFTSRLTADIIQYAVCPLFSEIELMFTFCELMFTFAICYRPSVVCLSSVTMVHSTRAVEIFRSISTAFGTLAICWHPQKILWRSSQANHSVGGVKPKRGSKV